MRAPRHAVPVDKRRKQLRSVKLKKRRQEHSRVSRIIGAELRELRTTAGMSQGDLATTAGFDCTYPSLLERGKRSPTLMIFINYVLALKADPARVLKKIQALLHAEGLLWAV